MLLCLLFVNMETTTYQFYQMLSITTVSVGIQQISLRATLSKEMSTKLSRISIRRKQDEIRKGNIKHQDKYKTNKLKSIEIKDNYDIKLG